MTSAYHKAGKTPYYEEHHIARTTAPYCCPVVISKSIDGTIEMWRDSGSNRNNDARAALYSEVEPEPSTGIVRSFSDDWKQNEPDNSLSQGIDAKVESDRRREERLLALHKKWTLLFEDANQLAQLYGSLLRERSCHLLTVM